MSFIIIYYIPLAAFIKKQVKLVLPEMIYDIQEKLSCLIADRYHSKQI